MRLDKFLKVSRLIKRRTMAKEVCDASKVLVNGNPAKSGSQVKAGDVIEFNLGSRKIKARILQTPETIPASKVAEIYELMD